MAPEIKGCRSAITVTPSFIMEYQNVFRFRLFDINNFNRSINHRSIHISNCLRQGGYY